jgi:hypothetical protein
MDRSGFRSQRMRNSRRRKPTKQWPKPSAVVYTREPLSNKQKTVSWSESIIFKASEIAEEREDVTVVFELDAADFQPRWWPAPPWDWE